MICAKIRYPTRRHAVRALKRIRAEGDTTPTLHVYQCWLPACGQAWHVGHGQA